jgi:hypothetical protein
MKIGLTFSGRIWSANVPENDVSELGFGGIFCFANGARWQHTQQMRRWCSGEINGTVQMTSKHNVHAVIGSNK